MTIGNTFENDLQKLIFQAVAIADIAENDSSSPLTVLEVSLHTANPDETGTQSTSETAYTNYARVPVARTDAGWTVSAAVASNAAEIAFAACGTTGATITHIGIGTAHTSTGKLLYYGQMTAPLVVSTGVTPKIALGALTVTLD
jgi:hypothetical protein